MKKIMASTLSIVLLLAAFGITDVSAASRKVWVAVTISDGKMLGTSAEYYGQFSEETFKQLTLEVKEGQMFKLESVFWTDDEGRVIRMSDSNLHGRTRGYKNEVFLRAEHIFRIVVVENKYVDNLLRLKKK